MGYDTGIAQRLRDAGLVVIEVDGWQTRGSSSFDPRGSVDHHTAGPATGNAPSLNTCIYGRPDLAGPLCNVLMARDNTAYCVAAGRANHAGSGGWKGLSGNSSVYGIERENVGTNAEPWRPDQNDAAGKAHAALIRGRADAGMVCRHQEWTTRKVDTHNIDGDDLRGWVADALNPTPSPLNPQIGDEPMFMRADGLGLFLFVPGGKFCQFKNAGDFDAACRSAPTIPVVTLPKYAAESLVY